MVSLAERELPVTIDDGRLVVSWIGHRDHRWLERLVDRLEAMVGQTREVVTRELKVRPELGENQRSWQVAMRWGVAYGEFEQETELDPRAVRRAVFRRAASGSAGRSRTSILEEVAAELGL